MPRLSSEKSLAVMTTCKSCGEEVIRESKSKRSFVTTTRKATLWKRLSWGIVIGVVVFFNLTVVRGSSGINSFLMNASIVPLGLLTSWLLRPFVIKLFRLGYFAEQEAETVECPHCRAQVIFSP